MISPQKKMTCGVDDGDVAKMFSPPHGRKEAAQAVRIVVVEDDLADKQFWQQDEYVGQGGLKKDGGYGQRLR